MWSEAEQNLHGHTGQARDRGQEPGPRGALGPQRAHTQGEIGPLGAPVGPLGPQGPMALFAQPAIGQTCHIAVTEWGEVMDSTEMDTKRAHAVHLAAALHDGFAVATRDI